MQLFFDSNKKKRVTKEEFKRIMSRLYGKLDKAERTQVEMLFSSDLNEPGINSGITQEEFDTGIRWLEENKSKHVLENSDIELLKEYFSEHLRD